MIGNIIIRPTRAILTQEVSPHKCANPYARVVFGFQSSSTKVALGAGQRPEWSDVFSFGRTNEDAILIEIWDKNMTIKDTLVGTATIPFFKVLEHDNTLEEWVSIMQNGKEVGQVLVEVEFCTEGKASLGSKGIYPPYPVYGAWAYDIEKGSSFGDFGKKSTGEEMGGKVNEYSKADYAMGNLDPSISGK